MVQAVAARLPLLVLCGHRDKNAQDKAYAEKKSKLAWPYSKHNKMPSWATDVAPAPLSWDDTAAFYRLADEMQAEARRQGVKLRWGGNWDMDDKPGERGEFDLVHYELLEA